MLVQMRRALLLLACLRVVTMGGERTTKALTQRIPVCVAKERTKDIIGFTNPTALFSHFVLLKEL